MVSEQYRVNVVNATISDTETMMEQETVTVRNKKASISGPIPASADTISVLDYFGITANGQIAFEKSNTMQAHNNLSKVLKPTTPDVDLGHPHQGNTYQLPEQVMKDGRPMRRSERDSTASSFSAWRSNCTNPVYSSPFDDVWSRMEHWWNIFKWPIVLLLICSILGLFIYFLVLEMEINESLMSPDRVVESNFVFPEVSQRNQTKGKMTVSFSNTSGLFGNSTSNRGSEQRQYVVIAPTQVENENATQKPHGFTSGHQNNFGVPIEEDSRILKILNDELVRIYNGTTTPRMTTSGGEYRTRVSPTLPLMSKTQQSSTTEKFKLTVNENCVSTSLPLCRGILHYDLTQNNTQGLSDEEEALFKYLLDSQCSSRAAIFLCTLFEPECSPKSDILPPCKRFCKSILEPCSQAVAQSELLTELFDCDIYPESHSPSICNDPTRFTKCTKNEFKCLDSTCIPAQWRCDNIKDCRDGDDEENCKFCERDEFKCIENDKCIPVDWRCDKYKDCPTGSDELDCIDDDSRSFPLGYGNSRIYPFVHEVAPDDPNRRTYQKVNTEHRQPVADQENAFTHLAGRHVLVSKNLANFQDSTEIMMTSDSETKLKYSSNGLQTAHFSPCPENELRCLSGRCIALSQLCDKVFDCSDGSDEAMCETMAEAKASEHPPGN